MLCIPKVVDYLEILTDEVVQDFVAINVKEYPSNNTWWSRKCVQLNSSDNRIDHYNAEIFNIFHPELQLIKNKPVIKNKLNELLNELKKFKVHTIFFLEYKKRNDCEMFHLSTKLTASNSDIHEVFKSIHQSIMKNIRNYASKDWVFLDVIIKHNIKNFEC